MRLAPLLAVPPVALGIAVAVWMISTAPGPSQVDGERPALPVRVVAVTPEEIRPTVTAWGNLRAADRWVAVAEVQGEVIWRHPDLEPGRLITAGTEVLRIDPADYELALAQAEADLAALEAERTQLSAEESNTSRILDLERDRLALAEADLTRTRSLAEQGTVPQSRADESERATLLARRTVAELENTLSLVPSREARLSAQTARSAAARDSAQRSLSRTTMTIPFDVRVTEVTAELYQTVSPGQVVIRGDGIATAEVVAHLPLDAFRRLIANLPSDKPLTEVMRDIPATALDVVLSPLSDPTQEWPARVSRIEGALDARARTVPVVVTVDEPYAGADPPRRLPLVPNMQVQLTLSGAPLSQGIAIPESAYHSGMVRIVDGDNKLALRPVTAAFRQNERVILTDGLAAGDRVLLDDVSPAIPGLLLNPIEAAE
ncbi:efflux RND transporter periplasmic adaptor subunit [Marivita sp. S2033]|uniref:efflux RND transporter periplasmic adaptor subunit n=1 Tax=Marivita sp. S2033 TaxID=3373187 RepID=UPI003981AFA6